MRILFCRVVFFITFFVMLYRIDYLGDSRKFISLYFYLVLLFVISMGLVIYSPNLVSILLGWDGLGLISYCLVRYYQNFFSYKSAILTLLINRVGDLTLVISICLMWGGLGWGYIFYQREERGRFLILIILVSGVAKRAQIPLSI